MASPEGEPPGRLRLPTLGPLEAQVMAVLWDHGPATTRQIMDRLPGQPAYTTIATVLGNLGRKGMASSRRQGRSSYFSAVVRQEELAARQMRHLLDTSGDRAASILHFVQAMPEDDLDLLRTYLNSEATDGDAS